MQLEQLHVRRLLYFGLEQYELNFMGRVYNNNLFYYIQMDYLTLGIRCILPKHTQKNCLLKILNRQLDIHIQLQNTFVHNYEYVYKLWPCEIGAPHTIQLQLLEKGEEQVMKMRGTAEAQLLHTYQGELYKFYGNRSEGQVYLMCFKVEKAQAENYQSKEQTQLRKMNSKMQESLLRYKEEIKNYQEFLYYTNNVIRQLNKDCDQSPQDSPSKKEYSPRSPIIINQIKIIPEQKEIDMIPTKKRRQSIQVTEKQTQRIKTVKISQENSNKPLKRSEVISQKYSIKSDSRASKSKVRSYLSKYRYLQQKQQSRIDIQKGSSVSVSQVRQKTPVKRSIQQTQLESPEIFEKRKKQFQIANKIKQRRQYYFMLDESKQVQKQMAEQNRSSVETPINRLSLDLASKISKHSKKYQRKILQTQTCEGQQLSQRANMEVSSKISTRSQTGLKEMLLYPEKKPSLYDYVIQSQQDIQSKCKLKQSLWPKHNLTKFVKQLDPTNVIIKSVAALVKSNNNEQPPIQEEPIMSQNQSIIQNIARRRKVIAKNSASILGQIQDMNPLIVHNGRRHENLNGSVVTKLTIYGLKSIFYANFKSNTRKCIIEHNGQVYQTDLHKDNLKNTAWNDRIVLNSLKPTEDLIFMVYAIRMDQLELQGSGIVKIVQVLSSSEKYFKLYLYFDSIAVGSIKFDVQREKIAYKRLSVSLPQIKSKSPPKSEFIPRTNRIKTQSDQASRTESHPRLQRQSSQTAQFNHHQSNSEFNQHELYMPNNGQITKKVRNIKLTKISRLAKQK